MEKIAIDQKNVQITKVLLAKSIVELSGKKLISAITISEITNNCGLCRETFYKHFRDKYDLIDWIYNYHSDLIIDNFRKNFYGMEAREAAIACTQEWLIFFRNNYTFVSNSFRERHRDALSDSIFKFTLKIVVECIKCAADISVLTEDMLFYARFYAYGQVEMVEEWLEGGMKESLKDLSKKLVNAIPHEINQGYHRYIKSVALADVV